MAYKLSWSQLKRLNGLLHEVEIYITDEEDILAYPQVKSSVRKWVKENCRGGYYFSSSFRMFGGFYYKVHFVDKTSAALFKLRYG